MDPISHEAIQPPANVLLLHDSRADPERCRALRRLGDEVATAELRVTFEVDEAPYATPGEDEPAADGAAKLGVISVGDVLQSAAGEDGPDFSSAVAVDAVSDPTDLSSIGVSVSRFCERWGSRPEQLTCCFYSLDALLRHTKPEQVFEFTYYLNKRLTNVGALAHFHLDRAQHHDEVVAAFGDIFDEVLTADAAGQSAPEATDEDIARRFDAQAGASDDASFERASSRPAEATDEEIERSIGR